MFKRHRPRKYSVELISPICDILEGYHRMLDDRIKNTDKSLLLELMRTDVNLRSEVHGYYMAMMVYYAWHTRNHIPQLEFYQADDLSMMEIEIDSLRKVARGDYDETILYRWL